MYTLTRPRRWESSTIMFGGSDGKVWQVFCVSYVHRLCMWTIIFIDCHKIHDWYSYSYQSFPSSRLHCEEPDIKDKRMFCFFISSMNIQLAMMIHILLLPPYSITCAMSSGNNGLVRHLQFSNMPYHINIISHLVKKD